MPPKNSKLKEAQKQDLAEKVKELKMRQQNWLKQREHSLSRKEGGKSTGSEPPSSSVNAGGAGANGHSPGPPPRCPATPTLQIRQLLKAKSAASKASTSSAEDRKPQKCGASYVIKGVPVISSKSSKESGYDSENSSSHQRSEYSTANDDNSSQSSVPKSDSSSVKSPTFSKQKGFGEWFKNRQQKSLEEQARDSDNSRGSILDKVELDTQDFSGKYASSGSGSSGRRMLEPEEFDNLADTIIRRVKSELNLKEQSEKTYKVRSRSRAGDLDCDFESEGERKPSGGLEKGLESHYCAKCAKLMIPPSHDVTLIIPCGHNLCKRCLDANHDLCYTCSCEIQNTTPNFMLQQIIIDYSKRIGAGGHRPRTPGRSKVGGQSSRPRSRGSSKMYTPDTYRDRNTYREDYRSLQIRCEALETESNGISETLRQLQKQMEAEKTQIKSINKEEQRLMAEVETLQQRLQDLGSHRAEYEDKCRGLEKAYSDDSRKLSMVQQSLRGLKKEAEKLKMLAGGDMDESF